MLHYSKTLAICQGLQWMVDWVYIGVENKNLPVRRLPDRTFAKSRREAEDFSPFRVKDVLISASFSFHVKEKLPLSKSSPVVISKQG